MPDRPAAIPAAPRAVPARAVVRVAAALLPFALAGALAAPASLAHDEENAPAASPALVIENGRCKGGDPIEPTEVIEGSFPAELQGAYVMVPFEVPDGTTQVRVKYCWDEPEASPDGSKHTIDLGLWQPGPVGGRWTEPQFRGWGGSSHPDVTITPQGFSTEEEYLASPKGHVPGRTTRGFLPGAIPPGTWAAELGVAAVVPPAEGDADGVRWRLEIALSDAPAFAAEPYVPTPYDASPAQWGPRWFAGDMHTHAEHSALGDATMTEVFDFAFRARDDGGAGLDFITLTDYVTPAAWGEIGRYQPAWPGKLVVRSSEIITYRGHTNNHASLVYVDHRTGPVYRLRPDGGVSLLRGARDAVSIHERVRANGGVTQVNHPTIFPSENPAFRRLCRGCPWDYGDDGTDWALVDAIEVQTAAAALGENSNPFTPTAIELWEHALDRGERIAAVGASDSHRAGRTADATQTPIGTPTTMVFADELSEDGIRRAIGARRTWVKMLGPASPDVSLVARTRGGTAAGIGDALVASAAEFEATVSGVPDDGREWLLYVVRDGEPVDLFPLPPGDSAFRFAGAAPSRYRLQVQRGAVIAVVTSPIWLDRPWGGDARRPSSGGLPTLLLRSWTLG